MIATSEGREPALPAIGLRARLAITFALGALLLSVLLSSGTWLITRSNQIRQREDVAAAQMLNNAVRMETRIDDSMDISERLNDLPTANALPRAVVNGEVIGPGSDEFTQLPPEVAPLRRLVEVEGRSGLMRISSESGQRLLVLGVPFPDEAAAYYEIVPLDALNRDLRTLALSLSIASVLTTFLGALLGTYAAQRTLAPLSALGEATQAISTGALSTRLEPDVDADLDTIVRSFNEMAESLEERIERDERFASDVSHELRSPLMTLSASIEVLERRSATFEPAAQTALSLLRDDVNRFEQLVNDLLQISRFDAGAQRLQIDEVTASEIITQAVAATGHDVPTEVGADAVGVRVAVDKRRIVQVMANLLDNAARYGDGAERVTVELVGEEVVIGVEDRGPGVPAAERDLIFERFSRGKESGRRGKAGGSGLGLSLVVEHVRLHGGRVWAEDRPDGLSGARFALTLAVEAGLDERHGPLDEVGVVAENHPRADRRRTVGSPAGDEHVPAADHTRSARCGADSTDAAT